MTVRDRVGRTRYVAFRVGGGPVSRGALTRALSETWRLTRFDGVYGIVRAKHDERDALVAHMQGLTRLGEREVRVETLATSGTIRKAAQALPTDSEAAKRQRPPRKAKR